MKDLVARTQGEVLVTGGSHSRARRIWAIVRISLGWIFLWAFLDGALALGFPIGRAEDGTIDIMGDAAWISGGSPTSMLKMATKGPLAGFFRDIAGTAWLDWLFMIIFLFVGLALILGIGMRIAATAGAAFMLVAWAAVSIWPANNPFLSEYLIYALVLVGLALSDAGDTWGLGSRWGRTRLVRRYPILR